MSDTLPTVRIKADTPRGYRIINESSFDAAKHELYDVPAPPQAAPSMPPAAKTVQGGQVYYGRKKR